MRRRDLLALLGASVPFTFPAWGQGAHATVGVLMPGTEGDASRTARLELFKATLAKLGWTSANLRLEVRWGGNDVARYADQAAELVRLRPDIIFCDGTVALEALRRQTTTIPIIFVLVTDPVGLGFVSSLARPGGNITGFSAGDPSIAGKWPELLLQISPPIDHASVLYNSATMPYAEAMIRSIEEAAKQVKLRVRPVSFNDISGIEAEAASLANQPQGALIVLPNSFTVNHRAEIIALAAKYRLPSVYAFNYFATDGGLMAYSVNVLDLHRRGAEYVDRVLRGAKPSDLPVQRPIKFDLVINLRTAKALGVTVSPSLLATADEVIE